MKRFLIAMAALAIATFVTSYSNADPAPAPLRYGLYIHFGIQTFTPDQDGQAPADWYAPTAIDVRGWVHAAREAGMTFAILTAKHESGFCLWPATGYDYSVANSPVKTDVVAEFVAGCKAEGIIPGVHYSVPDAHNEGGRVQYRGPVADTYFELIKKQIADLHTNHPGIGIQEIDVAKRLSQAQTADLCQMLRQLNPQCEVVVEAGNQSRVDPDRQWITQEMQIETINRNWFWSPGAQLASSQALYQKYNFALQMGRAFAVNVSPDRTGRIPDEYISVLTDLKTLIAGNSAGGAQSHPNQPNAAGSGTGSPVEKLRILKQAFDQGLISKEVYDQKMKEILNSM